MDAVVSIAGAEPWSATGSGRRKHTAVIVVHGFTANPVGTRPLGQRLAAEGYSVEVPLLPGHGTHHRDLGHTRYADWYATVEHLVDDLGERCEQVVLVGHSMGGTIALDLASRREEVAALAVINPLIREPSGLMARLAPVLQYLAPYVPRQLAGLPSDDIARPDVEESAYAMVSSRAAQSLLRELPRIRSQLGAVVQPLLVVRSPEDHTVSPRDPLIVLESVGSRDVRELVCERSYHVPQLDYDAPKVASAVLDLLADVSEQDRR
ncbi:MAG: alpha/beta hydrolase [Nitriliruptoraceae bacterium]